MYCVYSCSVVLKLIYRFLVRSLYLRKVRQNRTPNRTVQVAYDVTRRPHSHSPSAMPPGPSNSRVGRDAREVLAYGADDAASPQPQPQRDTDAAEHEDGERGLRARVRPALRVQQPQRHQRTDRVAADNNRNSSR